MSNSTYERLSICCKVCLLSSMLVATLGLTLLVGQNLYILVVFIGRPDFQIGYFIVWLALMAFCTLLLLICFCLMMAIIILIYKEARLENSEEPISANSLWSNLKNQMKKILSIKMKARMPIYGDKLETESQSKTNDVERQDIQDTIPET